MISQHSKMVLERQKHWLKNKILGEKLAFDAVHEARGRHSHKSRDALALFADAEAREDLAQQVIRCEFTGDQIQFALREPKVLRKKLAPGQLLSRLQ